jgi:hypothetical protein
MVVAISYLDFLTKAAGKDHIILLLCDSDNSDCLMACKNLEASIKGENAPVLFMAEGNMIKEIKWIYEIERLPALLAFKDGKFDKTISIKDHSFETYLQIKSFFIEPDKKPKKGKSSPKIVISENQS